MLAHIIKGNKNLAEALGVSVRLVANWRSEGILESATLSDYRRTIIYDLNKVFECLKHHKVKSGKPKSNKS